MNIIESLAVLKSSELTNIRFSTPHPGDPVIIEGRTELGRIDSIGGLGPHEAGICEHTLPMFLDSEGRAAVNGGPCYPVPLSRIEPAYELRSVWFWTWGDQGPGAHQGVEFQLQRPLFRLKPK